MWRQIGTAVLFMGVPMSKKAITPVVLSGKFSSKLLFHSKLWFLKTAINFESTKCAKYPKNDILQKHNSVAN